MNDEKITIDYFSDILCVWAWITQRRIDELSNYFENRIEFRYQCIDIFGDVETRVNKQWTNKGLYSGFADHVIQSSAPYDSAVINHDIWHKVRPSTSANPHMVIKAVEISHSSNYAIDFAKILRKSFFVEAKDISNMQILLNIAENANLDLKSINSSIENGKALAALMRDYQNAKEYGIKGSPCFVMNEGRQILFGNVGYRVLRTNIEELLNHSADEASWC